jgi:hypothetical protein
LVGLLFTRWLRRWKGMLAAFAGVALYAVLALLSVAAGDEQGRPDAKTLEALEGYQLLRTDQNGWIEVSTDGERLWVEVERE